MILALLLACTPKSPTARDPQAPLVDSTDTANNTDTAGTADTAAPTCPPGDWLVSAGQLCHDGAPARPIGANAMHVFGPGSADMAALHFTLAREFIGNMQEQPITGGPIQDHTGAWLHPLRTVVEDNRANGLVTLLSPMGWDGVDAIYAEEPSRVSWGSAYEERLAAIAAEFAAEPDVWLSVWNEPYDWTGEGFDEDRWVADMARLIGLVRAAGNQNLLAIPGSHMGQGAAVWTTHAAALDDPALIFDLHAYERWLLDRSPAEAEAELSTLDEAGLAWMIGEIGPMNAGALMDPRPFLALDPVATRPVSAWLWKYSDEDPDALRTADGGPNDNGNHQWGSTMTALAAGDPLPVD